MHFSNFFFILHVRMTSCINIFTQLFIFHRETWIIEQFSSLSTEPSMNNFVKFLARRCEPYKSPWNKRDKSVFYLVWCKPVKCMQTTLLLSAADQLLNKLGGVKELWINISDKQIKCCSLKWFYLHYESKVISFR